MTLVRHIALGSACGLLASVVAASPAYADNCGSLTDCYATAKAALAALVGLSVLFGVLLSMLLDFAPGIGTAKGLAEAVTGKDLVTGQELEWWERLLGIVPILGGLLGAAGSLAKGADAFADAARAGDRLGDAAKGADGLGGASKGADGLGGASKGPDGLAGASKGADDLGGASKGADDAGDASKAEDVWAKREDVRGREIQDALAKTDYKDYIETDTLDGFQKSKNFPLIDFISADGTHAVSVKSYNPFSKGYASGDTIYDIVAHAEELADFAPASATKVTLDVRVPPGTPPEVIQDLIDTVRSQVDNPRFEIVVRIYP